MLRKHFKLVVISILLSVRVLAQTPSYYHYTSADGLASSTVYQIIQDKTGFIWFATSNGVSKFDGQHFTTFHTNDGLNSNSIISIVEGSKGEIYFGNYEKGINVLRKDRIENYCSEIDGKSFALSYLLLTNPENEAQKLYAYRGWGTIYSIVEKKSGKLVANRINSYPFHINRLKSLSNGKIIAIGTTGIFNFENDNLTKISIPGLPETDVYCIADGDDGSYYIGTKGMIWQIKNNMIISRHTIHLFAGSNDVNAILRDKNNNLWFSMMNRGFFFIPNGSDQIIDVGSKMGLQNTLVNNYLEDNEGNIWVSTFGKGVYCLNNLYLKGYNENDGLSSNNVYSIAQEKSGKLIIGTFNGVNIFENERFDQVKSNTGKTLTENISSIVNYDNEFYVCGTFGGSETINISYQGIRFHMFVNASFCKTSDGSYLLGGWNNSIVVQNKLKKEQESFRLYIFGDSANINRVNKIFEDTEKNIWVGTVLGLCKISNISDPSGKTGWEESYFPTNPILNSSVKTIFQDDNNKVWFAGEKGVASYDLNDDSIKTYTDLNGFDFSSSTSIASDSKNRIWIGNMKGLYLFLGDSVKLLNRQTGLPSDEILSLFYDKRKNQLDIGTSNGISFLDISLFDIYSPKPLDVKLTSLKAGNSVFSKFDHLIFTPDQNHVTIDFKAISFSSPGSVKYKYILNGETLETDHDFLDFVSLKSGTYNLKIMAKAQNTNWSKPCFLSFRVLPRFVETIWFNILIILTLGFFSVIAMIWWINMNNKKVRKELELSERINELKHQALSAMMNPHFIFNSLNSVQYLINSHRNEEANDYIAMMAKLIRKNLDTAGSGFILLAEEMSRLKLYLDLEKLRFEGRFNYEIFAGKDVEINSIMIPNMIVQPFVENTLWHGIINSGNEGLVTVSFTLEDVEIDSIMFKALIIKVTDNGIGINAAKKNKKEDHISKGIQIIEERLRLLSDKMLLPKPIMLEDLSNRSNSSHGTEVIISLPPPLYMIITPKSAIPSSGTD